MADLNEILNTIATAIYGKDVRQGIYDGIDFIHNEYESIRGVADRANNLIDIYEQAVADAKRLSGELTELNNTGESLKSDLTDLEATLSDGREVLANLKTEIKTAEGKTTEAKESSEILQGLLDQMPDLDDASRIAGQLEDAYKSANESIAKLESLSDNIETLTTLNTEAENNIAEYERLKSELDTVNNTAQSNIESLTGLNQTGATLNEALGQTADRADEILQNLTESNTTAQGAIESLANAGEIKTGLDQSIEEAKAIEPVLDETKLYLDDTKQILAELKAAYEQYDPAIDALNKALAGVEDIAAFINSAESRLTILESYFETIEDTELRELLEGN